MSAITWGRLPDGSEVTLYTVQAGAVRATLSDYGARLVSLEAPDRAGRRAHVVLGFGSVEQYVADTSFQGAIVGRYGNRIAQGRFTLDGRTWELPSNNGANTLHGGPAGFDRALWQGQATADGVVFTLVSPDGDMGFPGALTATALYTLRETPAGVALRIEYTATTDAATVVNVTSHAYFNLAGDAVDEPIRTIVDHLIEIPAAWYTPTDAGQIPTGELAPVDGTPFDLRQPVAIGTRVNMADRQLDLAGGFDHNWVLGENGVLKLAARVTEPGSGRTLTVETTEPGVQFYSGNSLDGTSLSRSGAPYGFRTGFCLETQHVPDSPNQANFPSTVLRPGETMRSTTVFTFGVAA